MVLEESETRAPRSNRGTRRNWIGIWRRVKHFTRQPKVGWLQHRKSAPDACRKTHSTPDVGRLLARARPSWPTFSWMSGAFSLPRQNVKQTTKTRDARELRRPRANSWSELVTVCLVPVPLGVGVTLSRPFVIKRTRAEMDQLPGARERERDDFSADFRSSACPIVRLLGGWPRAALVKTLGRRASKRSSAAWGGSWRLQGRSKCTHH